MLDSPDTVDGAESVEKKLRIQIYIYIYMYNGYV